jgi:alginate O-acetyltransferase complex protein AlgI
VLFNSFQFIFGFLPVTLAGFHFLGRWGRRPAIAWLAFMSVVFYAKWSRLFTVLLLFSVLMNYFFSLLIEATSKKPRVQHWAMVSGIAANLGILCYFKYLFPILGFLHGHGLLARDWGQVILPLGISFFTFTQIAYLVDLKQGQAEPQSFISYSLFVTYFPHLIAGPILHHKEIMPQLAEERRYGLRFDDFTLGLTWFIMGLFKKVVVADRIAPVANAFFGAPGGAGAWQSWNGVLIYVMQLYFDFSGYSDMALGLARMFSIRFPFNFNSPYKAASIIEYWQRFHMTLTRYLTLYLYNPMALAASRRRAAKGKRSTRKALATPDGFLSLLFVPMVLTMVLVGAWHGAGMQFLIFGLLHGLYLCINHAWRTFVPAESRWKRLLSYPASVLLTLLAVIFAEVFFRAASLRDCWTVLAGMIGRHGAGVPWSAGQVALLAALLGWVWLMPNTQQVLGQENPGDEKTWSLFPNLRWQPTPAWAGVFLAALVLSLIYAESATTFLYFQF